MLDTIRLSHYSPNIDLSSFDRRLLSMDGGEIVGERRSLNRGEHSVTWYPSGWLTFQTSLSHDEDDPAENLLVSTWMMRITDASLFLKELWPDLPSLWQWRVRRVDYAWNFDVGPALASYLAQINSIDLPRYRRQVHERGVSWTSKSRVIKFYDRLHKMKRSGGGVLRFEVTNHSAAVDYLQDRWFATSLLGCEAAYVVLSHWLTRLGLSLRGESVAADLYAVKQEFGRGAASAMFARDAIRQYGTLAYKPPLNLMASSTYYRWHTRLRDAGLLHDISTIDPLLIPLEYGSDGNAKVWIENLGLAFQSLARGSQNAEQNLFTWQDARKIFSLKNVPEIPVITESLNDLYRQSVMDTSANEDQAGNRGGHTLRVDPGEAA